MMHGDPTYAVVILLVMLAGISLAGLRAMRGGRGKSSEDYFFGGHSLGWPGLAGSLFVTLLWCGLCIGVVTGLGSDRLAWSVLAISLAAGLLVLGRIVGPQYLSHKSNTLPEFLGGTDSDAGARPIVSAGLLALTVLVRIPLSIVIGVRLMHAVFGWDFMTSALLLIAVPGLFVVAGGFSSMVAVHEAAAVATALGFGIGALTGSAGFSLEVAGALGVQGVPWFMLLGGMLTLALWLTCVDQGIVQRTLASRGPDLFRRGAIAASAAVLVATGTAIVSFLVREPVANSATLQPYLSPLVGAGIVAAGIAALSMQFMSAATLTTFDMPWWTREPGDDATRVLMGRLATTVVVLVSIVVASFLLVLGDGVIVWLLALYGVLAGPVAGVAAVRYFWMRVHGRAIVSTLLLMWVLGLFALIVRPAMMTDPASLIWSVTVLVAASVVVLIGATRILSPHVPAVPVTFEKRVGAPKV